MTIPTPIPLSPPPAPARDPQLPAPRFSILLPTHNRADLLPFAIRSALWQTVGDFELLIAGDGCTDQTADVVRAFDDSRIRWFDLPKAPGIGYASRNAALRHARGTYVAYLAHDDIWFPDHLERLGACFAADAADAGEDARRVGEEDEAAASGVELAYSRLLAMDLGGRLRSSAYNIGIPRHADGLWRGDAAITMCSVVHTRACLEKYGEWDETLRHGGDFALWHRILARAGQARVRFVTEPTAIHFVAGWRRTRRHDARMRLAHWALDRWIDDRLPAALRVEVREGESQQEAVWRRLSAAPARQVAAIRTAVIQFQDALLWQARTSAGLFGLRGGLAAGRLLERVWRRIAWLIAPEIGRRYARLRAHTRDLETRRREGPGPDSGP